MHHHPRPDDAPLPSGDVWQEEAALKPIAYQVARLELTIINLAAHPRERERHWWPARLIGRALWGRQTPLASPRLDALRRLAACLHARPTSTAAARAMCDFLAAGWSTGEAAVIRLTITRPRGGILVPG
jgi:hypothetical protein